MSARGSISRKGVILTPTVVQAITIQERNTMVKALDFYYKNKSKLDSFLILINIYILFN
jgi:hypothetical protein